MINTVIEINQGEYTEKVILTKRNYIEVMNFLEGKQWDVSIQGDLIIDEMIHTNNDTTEMMVIQKIGDKFLPFYEGCERPQKLKGKGYLHIYGVRHYFNRHEA